MEYLKMTKPLIREHNMETGKIIDREMTDIEFASYEANKAEAAERKAKALEEAVAKAALLDRLGITADEAKLLFS